VVAMANCLFVCLQQIYYLRKNFQKSCLMEMKRKRSLAEKIAKKKKISHIEFAGREIQRCLLQGIK
jgi:hypothetical protein